MAASEAGPVLLTRDQPAIFATFGPVAVVVLHVLVCCLMTSMKMNGKILEVQLLCRCTRTAVTHYAVVAGHVRVTSTGYNAGVVLDVGVRTRLRVSYAAVAAASAVDARDQLLFASAVGKLD